MTEEEKELIYILAQKLTGAHPEGTYQIGIFLTNVERRMHECGISRVSDYLDYARQNAQEHSYLLSALSIHTTSWFRENPHYVILQKILLARNHTHPYHMWSCATSTGEEVYSFALLFEEYRRFHAMFDYNILGTDIDPISLETARRAVYPRKHLSGPVSYYKKHILLGSGQTADYFTFSHDIRVRCKFKTLDLRSAPTSDTTFDLIVCRNVLIYFQAQQVEEIIAMLLSRLQPGGHLILGHSEMIDYQRYGLTLRGHSVYEKVGPNVAPKPITPEPPRVIYDGRQRSGEVVVHDVSHDSLDQDPTSSLFIPARAQIRSYEAPKVLRAPKRDFHPDVILIGSSTGGPQALAELLWALPPDCPPIVIAQHIAPQFSSAFAARLSEVSQLRLGKFDHQAPLIRGHLYCTNADYHIGIERLGAQLVRTNNVSNPVNGHRPSVDFLFRSALNTSTECVAVLLSGMGRDGAAGMDELHKNGAYTMAQSEQDCVVFGMPKEAILKGAADYIGTAEQIHDMICEFTPRPLT